MRRVLLQQGPLVFVMDAEELPGFEDTRIYGTELELISLGEQVMLLEGLKLTWKFRNIPLTITDPLMKVLHAGDRHMLLTPAYLHAQGNEAMDRTAGGYGHTPVPFPIDGDVMMTLHFRTRSEPWTPAPLVFRTLAHRLFGQQEPVLQLGYARSSFD